MLVIASLTVSISKLRHYTNFSDRPPLSQYPGSAPVCHTHLFNMAIEATKQKATRRQDISRAMEPSLNSIPKTVSIYSRKPMIFVSFCLGRKLILFTFAFFVIA